MKRVIVVSCILWMLSFFVPAFLAGFTINETPDNESNAVTGKQETEAVDEKENNTEDTETVPGDTNETEPADTTGIDGNITISVYITSDDEIKEMTLAEFLPGVVAAEMPASFPAEALRAQAIAARSYIMYRVAHPAADGVHEDADVCTDPSHCVAWVDVESRAQELYGSNAEEYLEKILTATESTDGEVAVYGGEPILAAFCSISGGETESAEDVWGVYVPYLTSVSSPGEESAEKYTAQVSFTEDEFRQKLQDAFTDAALGGDMPDWITDIDRSDAGGIKSCMVGGVCATGTQLRFALGLNSADITFDFADGAVTASTVGYGHGVGMSQYGARAMAAEGSTGEEIVTHYYNGCAIGDLTGMQ